MCLFFNVCNAKMTLFCTNFVYCVSTKVVSSHTFPMALVIVATGIFASHMFTNIYSFLRA